jgi:hypothetical protein
MIKDDFFFFIYLPQKNGSSTILVEFNFIPPTHTLVSVRLVWRKGAIYSFFWWYCEGFLSEEKMDMAFRLEFCFFVSRQRKNKKRIPLFCRSTKKISVYLPNQCHLRLNKLLKFHLKF